jgi:dTDP-4-dehydrorhamnose reductase
MRIIILGSGGQLGQEFCARLPDAVALGRADLGLADYGGVKERLLALRPELVLNCAAYNAVDDAERDIAGAFAVNAFGVRALAQACAELGATLVHYSTNYVFGQDETRRRPYRETDLPGPVSAYGVSKLAGEALVQAYCPRYFVIRTAGVFGTYTHRGKPANFIQKMAARASRGEPLRVVNDQICTPTPVWDLADATLRLIDAKAYGLYHLTSNGECTWHELALTAVRQAGLDTPVEAVTSAELGAPARRPSYSVLACDAYDRFGFPPRPTWQEALAEYQRAAASRRI